MTRVNYGADGQKNTPARKNRRYFVLGISSSASNDEVKRAYRTMVLKHHPDKVATLGEDVRKAAEQKFKDITAAKDLIFKSRGIS